MATNRPINKRRRLVTPKTCYFCQEKKQPTYLETDKLQKFVSERGKIVGRVRSGLCSAHQRGLTFAVKHARHLALIPFVGQR
jgi:small subunit ribosomal protein S18